MNNEESYTTKLNEGDIIQVNGWIMLSKLESGCKYRVSHIFKSDNKLAYAFCKPRGKKYIVGHYISNVDSKINNPYLRINNITIVTKNDTKGE